MAKAKTKRTIGKLQRLHDDALTKEAQSYLDVITPEQAAKGTYEGQGRPINRGGTPIARWIAAGKISDSQALAISGCIRLWAVTGLEQRTTANYGERIASAGEESDWQVAMQIEARDDLKRIQGYFPMPLDQYWRIFENVCRWDEPAGVAGSSLGFGERSGQDRAHTIVCFVADYIATREGLIPVTRLQVAA